MNLTNDCPSKKIAEKEIDKCQKFVDEVLSNYDIDYHIIIEECGDHWIKVSDIDKVLSDYQVSREIGVEVKDRKFWVSYDSKYFIIHF